MGSVQSSIRAEVNHGEFPAPSEAEAFSAYAIASAKGLIPETENAALQTLVHPMTFGILGEGLQLFEGWALCDLASFRKRYRDNLVSCFESFLKPGESQFDVWTPCASYTNNSDQYGLYSPGSFSLSNLPMSQTNTSLPSWLAELYQKYLDESHEAFSKSLFNPRSIRGEYLSALDAHISSLDCVSCAKVHSLNGEAFCKALEDTLTQALSEVCASLFFRRTAGVETLEFELTKVTIHPISRN